MRFGFSRHGVLAFIALTGLSVAGCGPDTATAPAHRPARLDAPNADFGNLTAPPILLDRSSTLTPLRNSFDEQPSYLADDFVVPAGAVWTVKAIGLSGSLLTSSLPFSIRATAGGFPGDAVPGGDVTLSPTASDPNACNCGILVPAADYLFTLPTELTLSPGTYWVATQTGGAGRVSQFYWQTRKPVIGSSSVYGNGSPGAWNVYSPSEDFALVVFGTAQYTQAITLAPVTPNPAPLGSTVTLNATASSGLTVALAAGPANVCTLSGTTLSFVGLGTCTVTANQAGTDSYLPAMEVTQDIGVTKASQTITFTSTAPAPAYINGTYAVTATGGASGNPVAITVGPPNVCTATSTAVKFVGVGSCTVTANQAGNDLYDPAAPATQTVKVDYRFAGFLDPVQNGVINTVKAGTVTPLKWRLTDANGAPVAALRTPIVTVAELVCTLGTTTGKVVEQTSGASGLQNLGDGYYQYNWKSPASYAKSCKTLQLDLGEGSGARTARFAFAK